MKYFVIFFIFNVQLLASQENLKGLLPEIRINSDNEDTNMKKSFNSEVLITKSENNAIKSLIKIIAANKNKKEEVELLFRLAELYMRRAKSGRFFALDESLNYRLKEQGINNQKTNDSLIQAIKIYDQIRNRFPEYKDLDYVLFNSALAHIQIKEPDKSKKYYTQLVTEYPNSDLVPDALLELGEIHYNQRNYQTALDVLKKLEKFPKSKAYSYGIYKSAWCYYNLKNTPASINQLLTVVKENPAKSVNEKKYNLRHEALRDLTLFVGETLQANEIFSFFQDITTEEEFGEIILSLASLYESHSRFKEINIFTKKFIEHYPQSKEAPKCYSKIIDTNETLKQRPLVIENLVEMSKFCRQEKVDPTCTAEFRRVSLEISKKWWEIWLKNKNNLEFSLLTQKSFEILLSNEDSIHPDSKSRFAFSELLFQQEKYLEASQNYEIVSKQLNVDKSLGHDSLYGAIFSLEKLLDKDKKENKEIVNRQKELGLRYLKEFSNGEHLIEIQYKLGYIAYKQSEYDLSLSYILTILKNTKYTELRIKAEDLTLDIYNIKKDYLSIQNIAKNILPQTQSNDRKLMLKKIIEEANYSQVQLELKSLTIVKQIESLNIFAKNHADTKLGQDAYWQSISMAYSNGYDVLGATLTTDYIKLYPNDSRKLDALKDAAKAFLDSGNIKSALGILKDLIAIDKNNSLVHEELICDLLKIDMQTLESRKCYKNIISKAENSTKSNLFKKLLLTFKKEEGIEYQEIEKQILTSNIEPFATLILTNHANTLYEQKNYTDAFNLALKINNRSVEASFRAQARLIQAKILENEFVSQSVKAQENKLALVISIKTEKLDKAFTAYSSVIKMSKSEQTQLQALKGIDRLYTNFIDSFTNITAPDSLNLQEKAELKKELLKLTQPFVDKKKINNEQIATLSIKFPIGSKITQWSDLSSEATAEPQIKFPEYKKFKPILLSNQKFLHINTLIEKNKYDEAELAALNITSTRDNRLLGLYYMSIISEAKNEIEKSLWFLEKTTSLLIDENQKYDEFINYQKGKVLYSADDFDSALPYFEKILNMKDVPPQVICAKAVKAFSVGDYVTALKELTRLSPVQIYTYGVDLLHIELIFRQGDKLQASKLSQVYSDFEANRVSLILEQARISESIDLKKDDTLKLYQKALSLAKDSEQQLWIKRKIEFIKININNQITSYVGGK